MKQNKSGERKKLVIKIGTSTLTAETNKISRGKIEDIARQILILKNDYDIILVSSGAIATAKQFIALSGVLGIPESKQALSAIGQPLLMNIYNETFADFGLKTAQCLLTYRDFENNTSKQNTLETIEQLIINNYIPIVNENDTVSTEEIMLGDNDKLSALIANLVDTDLLIIASDIDGVFNKNPQVHSNAVLIPVIHSIEEIKAFVEENSNRLNLGSGGMMSKLLAAEICKEKNIEMWIVNGGKKNFILDALEEKIAFTKFVWG